MIGVVSAAILASQPVPPAFDVQLLCAYLQAKETDASSAGTYMYQTLLYNAAGVQPTRDSKPVIASKMQMFWSANAKKLVCSSMGFPVSRGSILKWGAFFGFDAFIYDVAKNWKLDLNRPDDADGRNLLDFLDDEIEKNRGNSIEAKMRNYRDLARLLGAKNHARKPSQP